MKKGETRAMIHFRAIYTEGHSEPTMKPMLG